MAILPKTATTLILEVESVVAGTWIELERQLGSGPDMSNFVERTVTLPSSALRENVRFRFRSTGDTPQFDAWFVDNVSMVASYGSPQLQAAIAQGLGDPVTFGPILGKNAIDFDGIDDVVRVPFNPALNPAGDFSLEFWARVDGGTGQTRTAISTVGDGIIGYAMRVNFNDRWEFRIESQLFTELLEGPVVIPNRMTHVAATFDATSGPDGNGDFVGLMSLYVDGKLVASKTGRYKPQASSDLLIGATHAGLSTHSHFDGILDEVRVWNDLRTATEIANNFQNVVSPSSSNLVGYYRFDEGNGTAAADVTTPANNGTLQGSPLWTTTSFESQPIFHRTLTASRLASLTTLDASNRVISDLNGAEFLVNLQSLNLSGNLLDDADLNALIPRRLTTGPRAGELVGMPSLESLDLSNNPSITSMGQLASLPELRTLNLQGTSIDPVAAGTTLTLSSLTKLTNLAIPSQILNPSQNVVTVEGQATSIPFQVGVLNLDGIDSYLEASSATVLGFNGSFTASAWIFPTASDTVIEPVFGTQSAVGSQGLHLGLQNNQPYMGFFGDDLFGSATLALNQWHQLTWVYDQTTSTQSIYVNGVLDSSRTSLSNFTGTDPILIGRAFSGPSAEFFQGSIDGARVFNRALSASEVALNRFDGVPLRGADVTLDLRFNDALGVIASDSSSYNRGASLNGGASFNTVSNVPWSLSGAVVRTGASGPITFTPSNQGIAIATVLGNRFPVVIRNAAPSVISTPNLGLANSGAGVSEGQTVSVAAPRIVGTNVEYDVLVGGVVVDKYVVREPGSADRPNLVGQVTLTDAAGQSADIGYRGSIRLNGSGFVDTGLQLSKEVRGRDTTFEAWVFPTSNSGTRFVFDTADGTGAGWALYQSGTTWRIDTGAIQFNTTRAIALNTWQHVAVTFDTAGLIRFYVNGVAVSLTTPVFVPPTVGTLNIGGDFAGQNSFAGNIDEFRVWDRVLSASEISRLVSAPVANDAPNLLGWWSFNEGIGSVTSDQSVQQNDATIRSFIRPVSASASSFLGFDQSPTNAINGSGLTVQSPVELSIHTNGFPFGGGSQTFWHTATVVDSNTFIEFDLGANFDLSDLLVWQFNAVFTGGDETDRGVKQYDLFVGTTPNPTTQIIADAQLNKASGTEAEGAQRISLNGLAKNVRYVRMKIDSNYGGPLVGLSEVRFLGTPNLWNSSSPPLYASSSYTLSDSGTYTLTAKFQDRDGGADLVQSSLTVNNVAPVITSLNQGNFPVQVGREMTFSPTVNDAGKSDTRTYLWDVRTNNGQRILTSEALNFEFTPEFSGIYTVRLTVTDSEGASSFLEQIIAVFPSAVISTPATTPLAGSVVTLGSANSSPLAPTGGMQGTSLSVNRTYAWTVELGTTTVASGTSSDVSFVPTQAGSYKATLVITDRFLVSGIVTDTLPITVTSFFNVASPSNVVIESANDIVAPDFDGVNDRISLVNPAPLNVLANGFTISAWMKSDTLAGRRRILSTANWTFGTDGSQLIFSTIGRRNYISSGAALSTGVWTHVAVTMLPNNFVEFFVNGVSIGMVSGSQPATTTNGAAAIGSLIGSTEAFDGMLRDVGYWSSVLTESQIAQLQSGDTDNTNPTRFWRLNEGTGLQIEGATPGTGGTMLSGLGWASHATGLEGDTITFTLNNLPESSEFATRTIVWNVTPATFVVVPTSDPRMFRIRVTQDGVYTAQANVSDAYANSAFQSATFVRSVDRAYATIINAAASIVADDVAGTENVPVTITARVSDLGNDTNRYTIQWSDTGTTDPPVTISGGLISVQRTFAQNGVYSALLTVTDAANASASRSETIQIVIGNSAPIAINDSGVSFAAIEKGETTFTSSSILANDTDVGPNDVLSIQSVKGLSTRGASVVLTAGGNVTYDPREVAVIQALRVGQSLTDTFTYVVTDEAGGVSTGTVTVTINGANDLPIPALDTNSVFEDAATAITGNLLTNDTDIDTGTVLTVATVGGGTATTLAGLYGTLVWNANGSYTYTLNNANVRVQQLAMGQSLVESFLYTVSDGVSSVPSSLAITIQGTNDAPIATGNSVSVDVGSKLRVSQDSIDDAILATSPVAYWRLSESQGTVISNRLAPSTPDGKVLGDLQMGASGLIANSADNSVQLTTSGVISIPSSPLIDAYSGEATAKSIELWFNTPNVTDRQVIYEQGNTVAGLNLYLLSGQLYFGAWDNNAFAPLVRTAVATNTNYHVVATFTTGMMRLYVNGTQVATGVTSFDGAGGLSSHPGEGAIGGARITRLHNGVFSSASGFNAPFLGRIDEVALYNSVLSPAQVRDHFNATGILTDDRDIDNADLRTIVAVNESSNNRIGELIQLPSGANLTVQSDGSYEYDPGTAFDYLGLGATALDQFTYTVADSQGATSIATVTITVRGRNDAPSALLLSGNKVNASNRIGLLSVVDPDRQDTVTFTLLTSQIAGAVAVQGNELVVANRAGLTLGSSFMVEIRATDANGATLDQIFSIDVLEGTPTVTLTRNLASIPEGTGRIIITAQLSSAVSVPVTVALAYSGTALRQVDYASLLNQIVIRAGSLTGTAIVTPVQDTLDEANETIIVDILSVTNGTESGVQSVQSSIVDDDAPPTVQLSRTNATLAEAIGTTTVVATLSTASGFPVTVNLGLSGTATRNTDYTSGAQIVIPAGSLTGSVLVTAIQDTVLETNETIVVDILAVSNGTEQGVQTVSASILDDDSSGGGGEGGSLASYLADQALQELYDEPLVGPIVTPLEDALDINATLLDYLEWHARRRSIPSKNGNPQR